MNKQSGQHHRRDIAGTVAHHETTSRDRDLEIETCGKHSGIARNARNQHASDIMMSGEQHQPERAVNMQTEMLRHISEPVSNPRRVETGTRPDKIVAMRAA